MPDHRFDALTRTFATRLSRRSAVRTGASGVVASALGVAGVAHATAQDATPAIDPTGDPSFLFVQTATSGTFQPNPGGATPVADGTPVPGGGAEYRLTLDGHHGGTIYFSDRPDRIFGDAPTQQFFDGMGFTPANPPNAALVMETESGEEAVIVLELVTPAYDEGAGKVTYGATILDDYEGDGLTHVASREQAAMPPETFTRASLFIDDCPDATDCRIGSASGESVGPIPRGPYAMCWKWNHFACEPCRGEDLAGLCNATYPDCDDVCQPAW